MERCEAIVDELDLSGHVQLATFHPEYQFAGEEVADPGSYTEFNRPALPHRSPPSRRRRLARGGRAPGPGEHPAQPNINRLRGVGRKTLHDRLKALVAWRAPRS